MSEVSSPGPIVLTLQNSVATAVAGVAIGGGFFLLFFLIIAGVLGRKNETSAIVRAEKKRKRFWALVLCPLTVVVCAVISFVLWLDHVEDYIQYYGDSVAYWEANDYPLLTHAGISINGLLENGSVWYSTPAAVQYVPWTVYADVDPQQSPSMSVNFEIPPLTSAELLFRPAGDYTNYFQLTAWPESKVFRGTVWYSCSSEWMSNNTILPMDSSDGSSSSTSSNEDGEIRYCPTGPNASFLLSCEAAGGVYTVSNSLCLEGYTSCGYCTLYYHLAQVCYYIDEWYGRYYLSTFNGACGQSANGPLYVTGPKPNSIRLRLMSIYDPFVVLYRLTNGTMRFNPLYRNIHVGLWLSVALGLLWILCWPFLRRRYYARFAAEERIEQEATALLRAQQSHARSAPRGVGAAPIGGLGLSTRPPGPRLADVSDDDLVRTSSQLLAEGHPCQICLARVADVKLLPCNHHCSCRSCTTHLINKPCPLCRTVVTAMEACDPFAPSYVRFEPEKATPRRSQPSSHPSAGSINSLPADANSGTLSESMHSIVNHNVDVE
jgi:hypothetical protein